MHSICRALLVLGVLIAGSVAAAGEPTPAVKPLMTMPGKLLFREDLSRPFTADWRTAKGKWEVSDGAMRGAEVPADAHNAAARRPVPFKTGIVQFDFKLDGAKALHLSINADKGHLCRVIVTEKGFTLIKDADKQAQKPRETLASRDVALKPGTWHTLVLELDGKDMLASVDGKHVTLGTHPQLDRGKAVVGLIVTGSSASFRNLRVWDATPHPDWAATRARLLQGQVKPPAASK